MTMTVMIMIVVSAVVIALIMMMVMAMMMVRVTVVRMIMRRASMRMTIARIGAALRIKRRLDLDQPGPQSLHHRFDHVIAPNTQTVRRDLRRQMAVAEMPGDANQMLRVLAPDFDKRLRRCDNLDQPAIFEHKRVPAAQRDRVLQIEQELQPARARHCHATPVTVVEIEHDGVGRRLAPAILSVDLRCADHD